MRQNQDAQVHVIEAIIVGVLVFVAIALAAVFRVPTIPPTFEQSELENLGTDALLHLAAAVPESTDECNEDPCPFENELERMLSVALRYEGDTLSVGGEDRAFEDFTDYLDQSLPDGSRYLLSYSNGVASTRIAPLNLEAPRLDVVVSHALVSPEWVQYSSNLGDSALIQVGEKTGFTDATTDHILDPLNREGDEWLIDHVDVMSDASGSLRVPSTAVYGTYKLCRTVACLATESSYFTVVPPGVYGAGSPILLGDRDNSTTVLSAGAWNTLAKQTQTVANGALDSGERVYLDFDGGGVVTAETALNPPDLRISPMPNCRGPGTATCHGGTYVKAGDADVGNNIATSVPASARIRSSTTGSAGSIEEGEYLYIDADNSATVTAADRRLSRVGTFLMGTEVVIGDLDHLATMIAPADDYTAASITVYYGDSNLDGTHDAYEPVYLDLVGNGQTAGLEAFDVRLSPIGSATQRYTYDMQLVVWFGI